MSGRVLVKINTEILWLVLLTDNHEYVKVDGGKEPPQQNSLLERAFDNLTVFNGFKTVV